MWLELLCRMSWSPRIKISVLWWKWPFITEDQTQIYVDINKLYKYWCGCLIGIVDLLVWLLEEESLKPSWLLALEGCRMIPYILCWHWVFHREVWFKPCTNPTYMITKIIPQIQVLTSVRYDIVLMVQLFGSLVTVHSFLKLILPLTPEITRGGGGASLQEGGGNNHCCI